ncbi:MAG: SDR family oxidoreductase [Desulfobacterales bacterium]|nr:SDR family oxidoreductase [Desulfobacterales bacterium]
MMMAKRLLTPHVPTTVKNEELVRRRREQIVLAAIKLFSKKGFHGTTLRELSEKAGLSHGNIYDYVGSKEDIFFLLHEYVVELVDVALNQSVEDVVDPVEKLRRMLRSEFNVMYEWADAILLIYQESHILKNTPLMKEFLRTEGEHIGKIERVLIECSESGVCQCANPRTVANLIKIMADSWVLKRWDLRDHVSQLEMEQSILSLALNGLLFQEGSCRKVENDYFSLHGKLALVINSTTLLGEAVCAHLLLKGCSVVRCDALDSQAYELGIFAANGRKEKVSFRFDIQDLVGSRIFETVKREAGPIDLLIHDLGLGSVSARGVKNSDEAVRWRENLRFAEEMACPIQQEAARNGRRKILYLAPWAWDRYFDPFQYETIKAGTISLTRIQSKKLASFKTNVNCIVPGFIGANRPTSIQNEMEVTAEIPLGRLGEIADLIESVCFLLSDSAKYVTGQVLEVAGGL